MAGPLLSTRQLNRAVLARQMLLERAHLPLPRALERMGFLQAQYAPSMYIGLWSRLEGFRRDDLTTALHDRRVVQGTLLRSTIHLVSAEDWWPAAIAVRDHRRRWWLGAHKGRPSAQAEVESAAARVRDVLSAGPRKRAEILAEVEIDSVIWNGANLWLDLVRVPPSGTWERRRADLYALAEDWLGPPPAHLTEAEALGLLLRRYLAAFGPAPVADAAAWAGVPPRLLDPVAEEIELRRFGSEDGKQLVDLPGAPLPEPDAEAPVRFLPTWDAILLAHARRAEILREEHRPMLFSTRSPQSAPSFLVDGQVAGIWRYDKNSVQLEPFGPLRASARRALDDEAAGLVELHR